MTLEIETSDGNVFADLGLANPAELSLKSHLTMQINSILEHRHLKQADAADLLGIPQPKVSNLMRGKLDGFSVEKLIHFLIRLDRNVEIRVKKNTSRVKKTQVVVIAEKRAAVAAK